MINLYTKRLTLRQITMNDCEQIFSCWASDEEVTKYLTWHAHKNIETTRNIVKDWISEYKNNNCYRWGIALKETNNLIGMIDVVDYINSNPVIGYVLGKAYWNNGYMTEALKAVLNQLFCDGYSRILIEADERNIGSNSVIIKNGFQFIKKETKQCSTLKPEIVATNWYVKTR